MKQCSVCGQSKDLSKDNFYLSLRELDGFHHVCRTCSNAEFKKEESGRDNSYFSHIGSIKEARRNKQTENLLDYVTGFKKCTCCNTLKPLDKFYKNSITKDKLTSWCKECSKERYLAIKQDNVVKEINDSRHTESSSAQVTR
jgi:hypothetical protein